MTFRLTFYIISHKDENYSRGLSIDLKCDQTFYNKYFTEINAEVISNSNSYDEKYFTKSFEMLDQSILISLKESIKCLETYARQHYISKLNAFIYGEERTNLINQIRTLPSNEVPQNNDGDSERQQEQHENKELWVVKDDVTNKQWIFT